MTVAQKIQKIKISFLEDEMGETLDAIEPHLLKEIMWEYIEHNMEDNHLIVSYVYARFVEEGFAASSRYSELASFMRETEIVYHLYDRSSIIQLFSRLEIVLFSLGQLSPYAHPLDSAIVQNKFDTIRSIDGFQKFIQDKEPESPTQMIL